MSYRRVTPENRLRSRLFRSRFKSIRDCRQVRMHKISISRALKRNRGHRGYRPHQANQITSARQNYRFRSRKMYISTVNRVIRKPELKWIPEIISHRLKRENPPTVSAETIYRFICLDAHTGGNLWIYLARATRWSEK